MATQAGLGAEEGITTQALVAHYLAGGNVPLVAEAMVAAQEAKLNLTFEEAAAADLAGRDGVEAIGDEPLSATDEDPLARPFEE